MFTMPSLTNPYGPAPGTTSVPVFGPSPGSLVFRGNIPAPRVINMPPVGGLLNPSGITAPIRRSTQPVRDADTMTTVINKWIASTHPRAPLAGKGAMFVRVGREEGVDPRLLAAIARKESQFGTKGTWVRGHNAWGYGVNTGDPGIYAAPSWEAMARRVAKALRGNLYRGRGATTIGEILPIYAPVSDGNDTQGYISDAEAWMRAMGADPRADVFDPNNWGGSRTRDLGRGSTRVRGQVVRGADAAGQGVRNIGRMFVGQGQAAPGGAAPAYGASTDGLAEDGTEGIDAPPTPEAPTVIPGSAQLSAKTIALIQQWQQTTAKQLVSGQRVSSIQPLLPEMTFDLTPPTVIYPNQGGGPGATGETPTQAGVTQPRLRLDGTPDDHGARALGDWQSDQAYDLFGNAGTQITSPVTGKVTRVQGQPGGNPQFAGYGVYIKTKGGQLFLKHLGAVNVKAGDTVQVGTPIGTLDAATQGGPHLHFAATHRGLVSRLVSYYTNGRQGTQRAANEQPVRVTPGGGWGGTQKPVETLAKYATDEGLVVSSTKRSTRGTASGGVSDHWDGSTSSYAMDLSWGGAQPIAAADRAASRIVRALGGPRDWGLTGGKYEAVVNGIRWQVIYRSDIGGNHWNHIHIGARKV